MRGASKKYIYNTFFLCYDKNNQKHQTMFILESNMNKQNFAAEYAYVSFTSYYYYGGRAGLGFTAKGC